MSSGKSARYNRFSGGPTSLHTPDVATGVRGTSWERVCFLSTPLKPMASQQGFRNSPLPTWRLCGQPVICGWCVCVYVHMGVLDERVSAHVLMSTSSLESRSSLIRFLSSPEWKRPLGPLFRLSPLSQKVSLRAQASSAGHNLSIPNSTRACGVLLDGAGSSSWNWRVSSVA